MSSKIGKVKSIQKGEIKPQTFTTQHKIAYEAEELVKGLEDIKITEILPIKSNNDQTIKVQLNNDAVKINDAIVWGMTTPKPECIKDILRQIEGLFNIGKEISGWSIQYYPPPILVSGKKTELVIKSAESNIAARYILCLGTMEVLNISANAGGRAGEGKIVIGKGTVMNFPIGICTASSIIFSNQTADFIEGVNGFRQRRIPKNPSNRHILVFDGHVNVSSLTNAIKTESKAITTNDKDADKLTSKIREMFDVNDVEALAKKVNLITVP